MVSTAMKCVRFLLFIFNFMFLLSGIALVAIGTYIHLSLEHYFDFVGTKSFSIPVALIIIGCVITFIAFFGCCGAIRESYCMVITFSIMLAIIFILELGAGITAYVYRNQLSEVIQKNMKEGLQNYNGTDYSGVTKTWNAVQHDFSCCGVESYKDWHDTPFGKKTPQGTFVYPDSCCKEDLNGCGKDETLINKPGCFRDFFKVADESTVIVGGVGVGVAFIQVMGVIFACCLASAIKREYEIV